jgi:hypothetical protein
MRESLRDHDVRRAAHGRLLSHARKCPDTLVINELGLAHGAHRIDIAVINGHIRGIEIKAEADNLTRLARQVAAYGQVVDTATLIVSPSHFEEAVYRLPRWWGVLLARRGVTGAVVFKRIRQERVNRDQDPLVLAQLLWREEAARILRERGHLERTLRAPRAVLYERLASEMARRELAAVVRDTLKQRVGWRDRPQP